MAEKYNHSYSIFQPSYVNCEIFNSYKNSICSRKVFVNEELQAQKNKIYKPSSAYRTAKFFAELSLVLSMPHQTKHRVGRYISGNYFEQYVFNINQYAQLQNLSDFANLSSHKKTLKFFENRIYLIFKHTLNKDYTHRILWFDRLDNKFNNILNILNLIKYFTP